jgi:DNA-binding CsgD family transcriptional regulator
MARILVVSDGNQALIIESNRPSRQLEEDARRGMLELDLPQGFLTGVPRVYRLENMVLLVSGGEKNREDYGFLTTRHREVLEGLAAGKTSKRIASELHITKRTVDFHIAVLKTRLDATNRVEMMGRARELGWV